MYVIQEIIVEDDANLTSFYKIKEILNPRRDELFNISMPLLVIKIFSSCFHLTSIIQEVLKIKVYAQVLSILSRRGNCHHMWCL